MSSIPSVLIQTCIATITKELQQLEHWLHRVPLTDTAASPFSTNSMTEVLDRIAKQMNAQQHTLNHIMDRMDVLEGIYTETKEIHIDENLDDTIEDESSPDLFEPVYTVQKNETVMEETDTMKAVIEEMQKETIVKESIVKEPEVVKKEEELPTVKEPEVVKKEPAVVKKKVEVAAVKEPEVVKKEPAVAPVVAPEAVKKEPEEVKKESAAVSEVVKKEPEMEEEVEEEEEEEEEVEEVEEEVEEVEEEVEEEEEAEGLQEIEYNGTTYYKDTENNIYTLDEQDEPVLIGRWSEKTQSVKLFRK